jgi:hypothetical protein
LHEKTKEKSFGIVFFLIFARRWHIGVVANISEVKSGYHSEHTSLKLLFNFSPSAREGVAAGWGRGRTPLYLPFNSRIIVKPI